MNICEQVNIASSPFYEELFHLTLVLIFCHAKNKPRTLLLFVSLFRETAFRRVRFFFIKVITTFNCRDLEMYFTIIRILQQLGQECLLNSIVNEQLVILNTESNI